MPTRPTLVLVIGATGSIGRLVVAEARKQGYATRALVRAPERGRRLGPDVDLVVGDVTRPETLVAAVEGVDAVIFTHGSDGGGKVGSETVDYGAVRNVLEALRGQRVRIAMMTAIGVTNRRGPYNASTESHDWKRRAERLVRASGNDYTIVRPGWFDYNAADEHKLVFLQGDTRQAGNSGDGVIARQQIAEVLVSSLASDAANRTSFELVAERGPAQADLEPVFAALDADEADNQNLDGVRDVNNQPLDAEPARVLTDLENVRKSARA